LVWKLEEAAIHDQGEGDPGMDDVTA